MSCVPTLPLMRFETKQERKQAVSQVAEFLSNNYIEDLHHSVKFQDFYEAIQNNGVILTMGQTYECLRNIGLSFTTDNNVVKKYKTSSIKGITQKPL